MSKIISILNKLNFFIPTERNINHDNILDEANRVFKAENGYVIIKKIAPDEAIQIITNTYKKNSEMPDFFIFL